MLALEIIGYISLTLSIIGTMIFLLLTFSDKLKDEAVYIIATIIMILLVIGVVFIANFSPQTITIIILE